MRFYIFMFLVTFFCNKVNAQNSQQSSYGGVNSELAVSVSVLDNGSIITLSTSNSFGNTDLLLSRISESGSIEWSKTYGGLEVETAVHLERTSDKGYIILGNTNSFGNGNEDIYVIKTDSTGNIIWSKTYGGLLSDFSNCVKQVPDGGYIIAGRTQSFGEGSDDGYLVRVDGTGTIIWSKSYGTTNNERFYYVDNTNDNGFIISGIQKNFSNYFDQLVVKIDRNGNIEFSKNFGDAGGSGNDAADCIKQTSDGGYILSGQYRAFGSGGEDLGLTKISATGIIQWSKVYGNIGNDRAFDLSIDPLGNYLLVGYTNSFGLGGFDAFLVKVNELGTAIWCKTYGHVLDDYFAEVEISQKGYIMVGYTNSFGRGSEDMFVVKTDFDGGYNIRCSNINVIENNISPIQTDIIQIIHAGGFSSDPITIISEVIMDKTDLLILNQPEIDSLYFQGNYEVPLETVPSRGTFQVDGVRTSFFQPNNIGSHLIKYEYEVLPGCIYSYEKYTSVTDASKYEMLDVPLNCNGFSNKICVPLFATKNIGNGVIGIEYCLDYNSSLIKPSGKFKLGNVVTHDNIISASVMIDSIDIDKIKISIRYPATDPSKSVFSGLGEIICVEFELIEPVTLHSQYNISVFDFKEFHELYEVPTYGRSANILLSGEYKVKGTILAKDNRLLTNKLNDILAFIAVRTEDKDNSVFDIVNLDRFGKFEIKSAVDTKLFFKVNLNELFSSHQLMKYRNGFDAFQMENIITNKIGAPLQIEPTPYTMLAADVDISDKIRANDISFLQEVIVKRISGFPQQLPVELEQEYLDWRFIDKTTVDRDESFKKSSHYPYYSSKGYCRDNVPDVPFYLSNQGSCNENYVETYSAIFLGDLVDGGTGIDTTHFNNHSSSITLDIDDVHDLGNNTYRAFLNHKFSEQDKFVSLDFALDYNESTLSILNTQMTVEDKQIVPQWLYNNYNSEELLFTSYSMKGYPLEGKLLYLDIQTLSGTPTVEDLGQLHVFVNGTAVPSSIRLKSQISTSIDIANDISSFINLYPNPADDNLTISLPLLYAQDVHIELLNSIGQSVLIFDNEQAISEIGLDVSFLPPGLYECLVNVGDKATVAKKVIVR